MDRRPRSGIIGLDGVPFSLLGALSGGGVMSFVDELRGQGVFTEMRSSLPVNSAVSWGSMVTGVNLGVHGVYGFTGFLPGTYALSFHSSGKLDVCACGLTNDIHDDLNNFGQVIECSRQPELGMFEPSLSVERCSEWRRMSSK